MDRGAYGSQSRAGSATSRGARRRDGPPPHSSARLRLAARFACLSALLVTVVFGSLGCAAALSSAAGGFADPLGRAILEHDDPETVRDGVPALLLALDALIETDRQNTGSLLAGARLYATYSVSFAGTPERAQRLSERARRYAERAVCAELEGLCRAQGKPFAEFQAALERVPAGRVATLYALGESWTAWIATHSGDWSALADLPRVEALLARVVALDDAHAGGNAHLYLGVLLTQRPESLGGKPADGRAHFERAIEISGARNLAAKVMYARYYARLVFDRSLHDRLLQEVLSAAAPAPGLTLANVLAKAEAKELLATADEYF
jgi:hypothetical protein